MTSNTLKHNATALATITATLTLGMGLAATASASPSSSSEFAGYQNCLNAAESQTNAMDASKHYLLAKEGDANRYYINAYQWQNGERVAVRVACTTSTNGQTLATVDVDQGRYTNQSTVVTIEVAGK